MSLKVQSSQEETLSAFPRVSNCNVHTPRPDFSTEAELLSHLKSSYDRTAAETESALLAGVQQLWSAVKTFFVAESDVQVRHSVALNALLVI